MTTLNDYNNRRNLKHLARIVIPIAAQGLIGSSVNLVDNLMIGSLGELELNAVGVSVQVFFVFWMFIYGFTGGIGTFISQFYGAGDFKSIRKTIGFATTVALSVGIIMFTVAMIFPEKIVGIFTRFPEVIELGATYIRAGAACFLFIPVIQTFTVGLRTTQQTTKPLIVSMVSLATNVVLNYILIFGKFGAPALGVAGAALATTLARFVELTITLLIVFAGKNIIGGNLSEYFGFSRDLAKRVVKNSAFTSLNELAWGFGNSLYVAAFARISISAGAAIQACNTLFDLFAMIGFSLGDAVLIMVGQKLGEGQTEYAYKMSKNLVRLSIIVGVVMGAGLIICSGLMLGLFNFSDEGYMNAKRILIVYGCTMWINIVNGTQVTGCLRCGGDARYAAFAEGGTVWFIGVPLAFITSLVLQWPVYFAVLAVKSEEVVKLVLLHIRYFSKKWLNNVVNDIKE